MFDCINRQRLLPTSEYSPGAVLPPHLSPFVQENSDDYIPPERQRELKEEEVKEEGGMDGLDNGMETSETLSFLEYTHTHTTY